MSLVSFAGAVIVGLAAGHAAAVILGRAIVVMLLAWVAGRLIGGLAQHCVDQAVNQYKQTHPIPEIFEASADVAEDESADDLQADRAPGRMEVAMSEASPAAGPERRQAMPGSRMTAGAPGR